MSMFFSFAGKRIREVRMSCGMSQAKLAELAGLSAQYLCQVENGRKDPSLRALYEIAQALDASLDNLMGNTKNVSGESGSGFGMLLDDCSEYERIVIKETVICLKESLKKNTGLFMDADYQYILKY